MKSVLQMNSTTCRFLLFFKTVVILICGWEVIKIESWEGSCFYKHRLFVYESRNNPKYSWSTDKVLL